MSMLDELKTRAKKSKAAWEQVDGLAEILSKQSLTENEKMLLKMILLISEQIRPIGSEEDINKLSDDVSNMLNSVVSQFKR